MFGFEKQKPSKLYEFDLEKELKQNQKNHADMLKQIYEQKQGVKECIRTEKSDKELDDYGILLQGYEALERVVKNIHHNPFDEITPQK